MYVMFATLCLLHKNREGRSHVKNDLWVNGTFGCVAHEINDTL